MTEQRAKEIAEGFEGLVAIPNPIQGQPPLMVSMYGAEAFDTETENGWQIRFVGTALFEQV